MKLALPIAAALSLASAAGAQDAQRVWSVEVASKPEVRGEMVYFTLDGVAVSLRVYEVNVAKTNEFNYLVDRGGDLAQVVERAKSLRPAQPTDDRIIVSSAVHQDVQAHAAKKLGISERSLWHRIKKLGIQIIARHEFR